MPLVLPQLIKLRTHLNESLDCVDITRWTGDRNSAPFISSQLHLLHDILLEALSLLRGPALLTSGQKSRPHTDAHAGTWHENPPSPETFSPVLPDSLSLELFPSDSSLVLTIRVLEPVSAQPNLGSRFAFAIGAQRRLEHDEMDEVYMYKGEEVRVREKVKVDSSTDPSLLSLGAKLGALERTVEAARMSLGILMGEGLEQG